jgi:hypothetical protein
MGDKRNTCTILLGKPEGKKQLGRTRRRCEDNIKINIREIEWGGTDWIHLTHNMDQWRAVVNTVMNIRFPYNFEKLLSG